MRQFKIITFLLMLLPFIGASVYGEPENQISKDSRFEIDPKGEIVITATRTKDSLKQIGGNSVELITSEEIENSGKTSVRDILSQLSGVGLSSSGGPGSNVSVFIRGADSKNLLVLIDGIMINDPSTPNRQSDIGNLLLDDIERIELIKGSQSVLYGSNATAGVLNIITKIGRDKPSSYVKLEGGSYDTKKAQAGTKGKVGSLSYSVTGSKVISEGFSSASDRNERILHDGNTSEKDGWQNQSLSAALTYKIAKDHEISLMIKDVLSDVKTDDYGFGGYAVDHFDYNQFAPDPNAKKDQHIITQQRTTGLKYSSRLFDGKLESVLGINQSAKKREHFDNLNQKNLEFDGSYLDKYWQGSFFPLDQHEVTIGLSSMLEDMLQKSVTPTQSISDVDEQVTTSSLWIQDQMFFLEEKLVMVLGARRDDHEIYGKADSFRFAPSFNLEGSHTLLKASWGSGFRSPSLYELFGSYTYFGQTTIIGNQELTPERSLTFDYGVQQSFLGGDMKLNLTYFKSLFENKIDYVSDPVTFQGGYENLE
ncbi:MAG: TonB-dependent receptor, partial [Deltaproteobacteria bacterium]|nr:TonB-dependent receptor [Deltaproteobacteria bacterium]